MKNKNSLFVLLIILLGILLSCFNFSKNININSTDPLKIHYIDIGQGDSILIQVNNKNLLIDSGPRESKSKLLKYLKSLDITTIDYVIATHPHDDHIGNMSTIIDKFKIKSFYSPKITATSRVYENMISSLKHKNLKINVLSPNTTSIKLGEHTKLTILSPNKDSYDNLNNYSPIIKLQYGKKSFLFTGDAEKEVEKEVLSKDIKCDVLKVGHHGSSSSTSESFISSVKPSIAVISLGKDNSYGHPHEETLSTLKANKVQVYRTDKCGTVVVSSDGNKIRTITQYNLK